MQTMAKVFDIEISRRDVDRECARMRLENNQDNRNKAMDYLVERCLLFHTARQLGIEVSDAEYDTALLDLLDHEEPLGLTGEILQELTAAELEYLLKRHITIVKYLNTIYTDMIQLTPEKLHSFYEEQREYFKCEECVRCAHIMIKHSPDAEQRINMIYKSIRCPEDFFKLSQSCSDCPSNASCGDLGWFYKGKMIHEIDEVAFSLAKGEVSHPFKSVHGYHIIMLIDKQDESCVPFDDIKDSLHARLLQLEKEYVLRKHIEALKSQFSDQIVIY